MKRLERSWFIPAKKSLAVPIFVKSRAAAEGRAGLDRAGTILAGFLHLASARQDKIDVLLKKKVTSIAYEQIRAEDGSLPVLYPFSQIGGAMVAQIAARLFKTIGAVKGF